MDIQNIVAQLRQEASRIEQAIAALLGLGPQPARRGRPAKKSQVVPVTGPKRRRMSAAARARIAAAKKASARKPMSPAMRKKLSAMMKARWAARKQAA